ncbi:hypothetical protein BH11MYX4_BH11MYX4_64390 [soil metagenome]
MRMARAVRLLGTLGVAMAGLAIASCTTLLNIDSGGGADSGVVREAAVDDAALDAGGDAPALCDADLQTDPASCGACGHSCCGAACAGALCKPEAVPVSPTDPAPFGPNAHVATRLDAGALTDDRISAGAGQPGYVYAFDPTAAAPQAIAAGTLQSRPSLVAVPTGDLLWTTSSVDGPSTELRIKTGGSLSAGGGGTFRALATSPGGGRAAATVSAAGSSELRRFTMPFAALDATPLGDVQARGLAFDGELAVIVASAAGLVRCPFDEPTRSVLLPSTNPVVDVAVAPGAVFFVTDSGELRSAPLLLGSTSKLLRSGFVAPLALAVDDRGEPLVLDAAGIHATRYGAPLRVASSVGAPIVSFAASGPWIYFVTSAGLFRVRS